MIIIITTKKTCSEFIHTIEIMSQESNSNKNAKIRAYTIWQLHQCAIIQIWTHTIFMLFVVVAIFIRALQFESKVELKRADSNEAYSNWYYQMNVCFAVDAG